MHIENRILSDITVFMKYARHLEELDRRETWEEIVTRNKEMHLRRFPELAQEIEEVYKDVYAKKVLPSMRSLQFGGRPIELNPSRMFNCFSEDTEFVASSGTTSFKECYQGQQLTVLTHTGAWKPAIVKSYGTQKLYTITLKRGRSSWQLRATRNHKWILVDGTTTTNLRVGDKLLNAPPIFNAFDYAESTPEERLYWAYGYVFGDGTCVRDAHGEPKYSMVRLCGREKAKFLNRFLELGFGSSEPLSCGGDAMVYTGTYLKTAPDPTVDSPELIRAFVAGYLDADGAKTSCSTFRSKFRSIVASNQDHQYVVEKLFPVAGVWIFLSKDISGQRTNFGIRGDSKFYSISTDTNNKQNMFYTVESIVDDEVEAPVWCLEVEDDNSFVLPMGVATGNCSFVAMDHPAAFQEMMFLLLSGCGVGYSVQQQHIEKLPEIRKPTRTRRYVVSDSIIGWADAVKVLMRAYFGHRYLPVFDFRDIREKGAKLVTSGGKAPGPEPLADCLHNIKTILDRKETGSKLTSLEVHDICCFIADAVLSGGIRRSATIVFFNLDDYDMATCKYGDWYEREPQRARANNSAAIVRHRFTEADFRELWDKIRLSGSGEPGLHLTNNSVGYGSNPCVTSDTWVHTTVGPRMVAELVNKPFNARVNGEAYSSKGFWSTGRKQVHEVTTTRGYTIVGTDDHPVLVHEEDGLLWKPIGNLQEGDLVCLQNHRAQPRWTGAGSVEEGWLVGQVLGDGGFNPQKYPTYLRFWGKTKDVMVHKTLASIRRLGLKVRSDLAGTTSYLDRRTVAARALDKVVEPYLEPGSKRLLPAIERSSAAFHIGFLRGWFDTDGSVQGKRRKGVSIRLSSVHRDALLVGQRMLLRLGIAATIYSRSPLRQTMMPDGKGGSKSYTCQPSYELVVANDNIQQFAAIVGFDDPEKQKRLELLVSSYVRTPNKEPFLAAVQSVTPRGIEEVYDCTVDTVHCFDANGITTHNCHEISLKNMGFCNLTSINTVDIVSQEDLNGRAKSAAFLGTLQAAYTEFHYLRDEWEINAKNEALLGVSLAGIASGPVLKLDLRAAADVVRNENARVAKLIGINPAKRLTCVKPDGTTSLVLGCSSGIHAWHDKFYIRRVRVGKNEAIYKYLAVNHPELVEDDYFKSQTQAIIKVPQKAPEGAILRGESPLDLLERVKKVYQDWVLPGHTSGPDTHNVSCTVSIKQDEWDIVGDWMWENRDVYSGLSVLPYDDHTYVQPPFETITEEQYNELIPLLHEVDLTKVNEKQDDTALSFQAACAGGACEIV